MNHAITVGGLLSVIAIIVGLGILAWVALMLFASMMSDASPGDSGTPWQNFVPPVIGLILIMLGLWGLVR